MTKQLFLKRWLLQGIVVTFPILVTLIVLYLIVVKTDQALGIVWNFIAPETKPSFPGLGLILVISLLIITGMLTESWLIRQAIKLFNFSLSKLPFIRNIYTTALKIIESVINSQDSFSTVVLIEYPKEDCYTVAFLTGEATAHFKSLTGENDLVSVFIPSTPLPSNGFYLLIPKNKIKITTLTTEEAFKLIVSVGIVKEEKL